MDIVQKLKGSTIIEVTCSAVIFMIIFFISIDVFTRLTILSVSEGKILFIKDLMCEKMSQQYEIGIYEYDYDWGKICIDAVDMGNSMQEKIVKAFIYKSNKILIIKRIETINHKKSNEYDD